MTREEQFRIIEAAQRRAYEMIDKTLGEDMDSESFGRLLYHTQQLECMARPNEYRELYYRQIAEAFAATNEPEEDEETPTNLPKVEATRVGNKVYAEVVEPDTTPAVVITPAAEPAPEVTDAPKLKMEDVRAALAKARGKGVNVSEIIRSFGVDNFTGIDASQYPAVLEKLAAAEGAV